MRFGGLISSKSVGATRWHNVQVSAILVAGLIFLMFILFSVVMILGLAGIFP